MRLLLAGLLLSGPALAATPEQKLAAWIRPVDAARMKASVESLVALGTRHTLSSQTDPNRGIGAAWTLVEAAFRKAGLEPVRVCDTVSGDRLPAPVRVCDILAVQRGTERPNDVAIISGHLDSRVSDVMDSVRDAPGANDDGSGTAAVLEAARVLAPRRFAGTIVFAVLTGEEQGLYGGKILADHATRQRWNVVATLNNDIIGNSCGSDGVCDAKTVRVFSEGPRWQGHEALAAAQRALGGENDSPSRNLSRFLAGLATRVPSIGLTVRQVWRTDRFGRGGDHIEMLDAGFPAVRLSVAVENYRRQHQDVRVEKGIDYGDTVRGMDFAYLAKITRLNVAALAALASAPPPPAPTVEGAVSTDTKLSWKPVRGATGYVVRWRRTDGSAFTREKPVAAKWACFTNSSLHAPATGKGISETFEPMCEQVLPHIRVDDWVFGVSSLSADGFESPVASAVPGGAFGPYVKASDGK
ncbi:M20/M25/M40 family metallo-hydrolase [Sphingomonas sp. ASV193]|uniref:M20/M25/M40 family metallo-hydrolase n=1 Tax=Sphingomonas sp. ASV193 TaxID=3144405 RepID=UPI0032E8B301